jgi:hypothetical protein
MPAGPNQEAILEPILGATVDPHNSGLPLLSVNARVSWSFKRNKVPWFTSIKKGKGSLALSIPKPLILRKPFRSAISSLRIGLRSLFLHTAFKYGASQTQATPSGYECGRFTLPSVNTW